MRNALTIMLLSLCLGSCLPGHNDYSEYKELPVDGWPYSQSLTFTPDQGDSLAYGTLSVALRHTNLYPYANLYLEVSYADTIGTTHRDTLNIKLADRYGRWLGKGVGTDFQIVDTVSTRHTRIKGSDIKVRHVMRTDTLCGIDMVGLTFVEPKE